MRAAGIIGAGVALIILAVLAFACGGECNWKGGCRPDAAPAALTAGCAPPDTGPDCTCPDGGEIVVLPTCGIVCGL